MTKKPEDIEFVRSNICEVVGPIHFVCCPMENEKCKDPNGMDGKCSLPKNCPSIFETIQPEYIQIHTSKKFLSDCNRLCGNKIVNGIERPLVCCATESPGELPKSPDCGFDIGIKIYGGKETDIMEYPWTALLRYERGLKTVLTAS